MGKGIFNNMTSLNYSHSQENNKTWEWDVSFLYQASSVPYVVGLNLEVQAFLFLLQRPWRDNSTCLALTDVGGNFFKMAATFTPPLYDQYIGPELYEWANQNVPVFNQKHACT